MRVLRNSTTALTLSVIVALATLGSGCEYARKVIAKDLVNQGAIQYNSGHTKKAQEFFKEATETDPGSPISWLYYGATLVKDYKAEIDDARKRETANKALDVYNKALSLANGNCVVIDNALSYIASIHDDLKNFEEWRKTMENRATNSCTKKDAQAQSYYSIGVKYWQCSYDQTTRYADKALLATQPFHYRNMDYPAALPDKQKAGDCVTKGLENLEKAIEMDSEYVDAMFYKGLLYRERQKLTKEEPKRKELDQMAVKIADEATALQRRKEEAAAQQKAQEQAAPKG
jgi:tetratricopeptide (TPR) repeat protein